MSVGVAVPIFCVSIAVSLVASIGFARKLDEVSERLGASEGLHGILTGHIGTFEREIRSVL